MKILTINNLSKSYGKQLVLNNIDLTIAKGEFFGLIGGNGAGKTTLIKSILDFCAIDQGKIYLLDTPHFQPQARRHLAFLPEQFSPPCYLTGHHFLRYIAHLHGQRYEKPQIEYLCQRLDLTITALDQPVRSYSKGMTQKLGLIACFLTKKQLLILDEPMNGLDPKARAYLKQYLLGLKQQGITLFFSTHLLTDVEALCDRMAILNEGCLQFIGSPQDCCQQYQATHLEQAYLRCINAKLETPLSPIVSADAL